VLKRIKGSFGNVSIRNFLEWGILNLLRDAEEEDRPLVFCYGSYTASVECLCDRASSCLA